MKSINVTRCVSRLLFSSLVKYQKIGARSTDHDGGDRDIVLAIQHPDFITTLPVICRNGRACFDQIQKAGVLLPLEDFDGMS